MAKNVLDPEVLTICFARRFATYKRATLLFREPDTLARIIANPERPMQLIIAGKAHPRDDQGKDMIRNVIATIKDAPFRERIVFIEDYDINVARYMVQGADVWLNTPRRPLEACGTSGMKAAANGALNLSILDGWWDEGYMGDNGWAIGWGEEYRDPEHQDEIESHALYDLLEGTVKPLFYERGVDDLPRKWVQMMKRSLQTICPIFNSLRMVSEYIESAYAPLARNSSELRANNYAVLRQMVAWQKRMAQDWEKIRIQDVRVPDEGRALQGKEVEVIVTVDTAGHRPDEVKVELLHGPIDLRDNFKERHITCMTAQSASPDANGNVIFSGLMPVTHTGLYGYVVQITPDHANLPFSQALDLIHRG
jgi:starch phosphorylase